MITPPPARSGRVRPGTFRALTCAGLAACVGLFGAHARAEPGPDAGAGEPDAVDWRGLHRMDETGTSINKEPPPPSPVTALVQNAPYRIHVASTDGQKVTITDAFTLERRRVFSAGAILGYDFSNDGHFLYVVHDAGLVSSVEVQTAQARRLGRARLKAAESVVEVIGHGNAELEFVTVVVGRGPPFRVGGPCKSVPVVRRVRIRREGDGKPRVVVEQGPHDLKPTRRRKATSPNTHFTVELSGRQLISRSRMGSHESRLNGKPLLEGALALQWMRDSRGVLILAPRPPRQGCDQLLGLQSLRQPPAQRASWRRQHDWELWTLPADVQVVRGDLPHQNPALAPDGMRLIGHDARGVVLVEPAPRFRGHVALIAPPSTLWPAVRPGVRSLVAGAGELRMAEIHMEQGDIDAARALISEEKVKSASARSKEVDQAIVRIEARLARLEAVRARRATELGLPPAQLRSEQSIIAEALPAPAPATPATSAAP